MFFKPESKLFPKGEVISQQKASETIKKDSSLQETVTVSGATTSASSTDDGGGNFIQTKKATPPKV